jgi:hypothetical protein
VALSKEKKLADGLDDGRLGLRVHGSSDKKMKISPHVTEAESGEDGDALG